MKGGKLTKLKSALKKWPSFPKFDCNISSSSVAANDESDGAAGGEPLHTIYVGTSRRRYLVSSEVMGHPLFQVLVDKSSGGSDGGGAISVACEVVLFDHLLWMLGNADSHSVSADELVEFYSY